MLKGTLSLSFSLVALGRLAASVGRTGGETRIWAPVHLELESVSLILLLLSGVCTPSWIGA